MSETTSAPVAAEPLAADYSAAEMEFINRPSPAGAVQELAPPDEAPEAPVEEAAPEDAAPEAEPETQAQDDDELPPGTPRWARKMLKQLATENRELRQALTRPAAPQAAPEAPRQETPATFDPTPYIGPKPDAAKYEAGVYDPQYAADLARWEVKGELAQHALTQQQRAAAHREQALSRSYVERVERFKEAAPDYDAVAYSVPISDTVGRVLAESETGPQVAYWLGKNPAEAQRISGLPPAAQLVAIGRIEARLEAAKSAPKPTVSKAPEPLTPLRGRATPSANSLSPTLPAETFFQNYEKQRRAWRG
jgi:hypothetical protein